MPKQQDLVRKSFGADLAVGDNREVRARVSTEGADRVGDIVVQKGIDVTNFLKSRTVLWNHDQDHPVAACLALEKGAGGLVADVRFPDAGISAKADEVYGLVKAGVINAASVGFLPRDVEPVDGRNPRKGLRVLTSDLMEFSFVSVPANPGAEILQRAYRGGGSDRIRLTSKGLWDVAELARILWDLGFQVDSALGEAAPREGDASDVPAQLHAGLTQLGQALIAMTQEEVGELLSKPGTGFVEDDIAPIGDVMTVLSGRAPLRKAGRRFSAGTRTAMQGHLDAIGAGHAALCAMLAESDPDAPADDGAAKRLMALRRLALVAAPIDAA